MTKSEQPMDCRYPNTITLVRSFGLFVPNRCNGFRDCEAKTDTLGNPDPCVGIFKYYNTTYNCINGRK